VGVPPGGATTPPPNNTYVYYKWPQQSGGGTRYYNANAPYGMFGYGGAFPGNNAYMYGVGDTGYGGYGGGSLDDMYNRVAQMQIANTQGAANVRQAEIGADATKYGHDKQLAGTDLSTQRQLQGTQYGWDAQKAINDLATQRQLEGLMYGANTNYGIAGLDAQTKLGLGGMELEGVKDTNLSRLAQQGLANEPALARLGFVKDFFGNTNLSDVLDRFGGMGGGGAGGAGDGSSWQDFMSSVSRFIPNFNTEGLKNQAVANLFKTGESGRNKLRQAMAARGLSPTGALGQQAELNNLGYTQPAQEAAAFQARFPLEAQAAQSQAALPWIGLGSQAFQAEQERRNRLQLEGLRGTNSLLGSALGSIFQMA
jgi:hypothetical protein